MLEQYMLSIFDSYWQAQEIDGFCDISLLIC